MKTSKQLREERKSITEKIDAIKTLAADRDFSETESTELRTLLDSESKITNEIEVVQSLETREAKNVASKVAGTELGKGEEREKSKFSLLKVVQARMNNREVEGFEKEMLDESAKEARSLNVTPKGVYLSNDLLNIVQKRTVMIGGSGNVGADFIPLEKVGFFDALYAKTVLDSLGAMKLTGLVANTDLPGFSTGITVGWGTEIAAASITNPATVSRTLRPKRLSAYSDLSKQLLLQTNNSIEQYVLGSYMKAMAAALEAACINGTGDAPAGLLGTANVGSVAVGTNGGAPTLANILKLVANVANNNADIANCKWLINPSLEAKLKQVAIDSGSGAMIMAYQQYFNGQPGVIDGKPVAVTSNVPSTLTKGSSGAVCSAAIFGDFSNMVIGQFGGIDIIVDPYTQATTGTVRIVIDQFADMAILNPKTFAACQDFTTT